MDKKWIVLGLALVFIVGILWQEIKNNRKLRRIIQEDWGNFPKKNKNDREKELYKSYIKLRDRLTYDSQVDDITWKDLDMFEVFKKINQTYSSLGSEGLYRYLRLFEFKDYKREKMEELIEFYQLYPKSREKIAYHFARLGKKNDNLVVSYLLETRKKPKAYLSIFILLGLLPMIGLILTLWGKNPLGFVLLFTSLSFNTIYSALKKREIEVELRSMAYFIQSLQTASKISKISHPYQEEIKNLLSPFKSALGFSFAFRMKGGSEMDLLLDYLDMVSMLPFIAYHFVFNRIKSHEEEAIKLVEVLGYLEVGYGILNYRTCLFFHTKPIFHQEDGVFGQEIYHPLVQDPVANPLNWIRNTIVSGSNASGKSTYVKSVAINCILAQTINTCLAECFSMKRGHVLTSMAVEDNIVEGDSYFIAEIMSLKRILDRVSKGETTYLFVDEILRGTNTVERIAASSSVIHWIRNYPSLAFIATHDIELTEILKYQCDNIHFKEEIVDGQGVQFNYKLQEGPSTTRNALLLLDKMDFPSDLVKEARARAESFDRKGVWLILDK